MMEGSTQFGLHSIWALLTTDQPLGEQQAVQIRHTTPKGEGPKEGFSTAWKASLTSQCHSA